MLCVIYMYFTCILVCYSYRTHQTDESQLSNSGLGFKGRKCFTLMRCMGVFFRLYNEQQISFHLSDDKTGQGVIFGYFNFA